MSRLDDAIHDLVSAAPPPTDLDTLRRRVRRRQRSVAAVASALVAIVIIVVPIAVAGHGSRHESITVAPSTTVASSSTVAPSTVVAPAHLVYGTPLPRRGAAIAYDQARNQVVLFGGTSTVSRADTWLWDGHGWSEAHPPTSPPAVEDAVMAYDPNAKDVVLFGGTERSQRTSVAQHDTWTWNGTTWARQHPEHQPPWSNGLAMSYDPRSHSVLLLTLPSKHPNVALSEGSVSLRGVAPFGTWQWSGSDWRELPTPTAPLYATKAAAFDTSPRLTPLPNGAGLLFYSWAVYDGSCPPGDARCGPGRDHTGTRNSQTFTWDGTRWTEQHPHRAPVQGVLVATPGADASPAVFAPDGATWHWTGTDWQRAPGGASGFRSYDGFAVYDQADNDVVAYAGLYCASCGNAAFGTWTWNGAWTERSQPAPPARCVADQLEAHAGWGGEEGGLDGFITLRNAGAPCTLDVNGATVALFARGGLLPVSQEPAGQGRDMSPRVLPTGGSAAVIAFWSNWCKPDPGPLRFSLTFPEAGAPLAFAPAAVPFVPRCDQPTEASSIEFLGFSAA